MRINQGWVMCLAAALAVTGCQSPRNQAITQEMLLIQTGEAQMFRDDRPNAYRAEVYYPIPYASPPHLEFPNEQDRFLLDLKQTPEGFSVLSGNNRGGMLRWRAKGVARRLHMLEDGQGSMVQSGRQED